MFNIFHRQASVFELFDELAAHAASGAQHLHRLASAFPAAIAEIRQIHGEHQQADEVTHRVRERLAHTFMPPIDSADVQALADGLEHIVKAVDAVSKRIDAYHVDSIEPGFPAQTQLLVQATQTVRQAVHQLQTSRRLAELGPSLVEIHRLEDIGDTNHNAALSKLFEGSFDALFVMKWKELYTLVEDAIDACDDVGNTLERIALKG